MNWKDFAVNYGIASLGVVLAVALPIVERVTDASILTNVLVISGFASLLFVQISIMLHQLVEEMNPVTEYIDHQSITKPVRESEFYDEFELDVKSAEQRVFITYFDNEDPRKSHDATQSTYYDQIDDVAKEKEGVKFRRLIRGLPQLEDWVDDLIDTHEGNGDFSLGVILDEDPEVKLKSHIPVQLIDQDILYFVAVGEQHESGSPRDMFVQSKELNTQWERYYERMWEEDSLTLISRGRVRTENLEKYKDHIAELEND